MTFSVVNDAVLRLVAELPHLERVVFRGFISAADGRRFAAAVVARRAPLVSLSMNVRAAAGLRAIAPAVRGLVQFIADSSSWWDELPVEFIDALRTVRSVYFGHIHDDAVPSLGDMLERTVTKELRLSVQCRHAVRYILDAARPGIEILWVSTHDRHMFDATTRLILRVPTLRSVGIGSHAGNHQLPYTKSTHRAIENLYRAVESHGAGMTFMYADTTDYHARFIAARDRAIANNALLALMEAYAVPRNRRTPAGLFLTRDGDNAMGYRVAGMLFG